MLNNPKQINKSITQNNVLKTNKKHMNKQNLTGLGLEITKQLLGLKKGVQKMWWRQRGSNSGQNFGRP
jgi:hypothetical protein